MAKYGHLLADCKSAAFSVRGLKIRANGYRSITEMIAQPVIVLMEKSNEATKEAIKQDVYVLIKANLTSALLDFGALFYMVRNPDTEKYL